jgi:hypothetical protein
MRFRTKIVSIYLVRSNLIHIAVLMTAFVMEFSCMTRVTITQNASLACIAMRVADA